MHVCTLGSESVSKLRIDLPPSGLHLVQAGLVVLASETHECIRYFIIARKEHVKKR